MSITPPSRSSSSVSIAPNIIEPELDWLGLDHQNENEYTAEFSIATYQTVQQKVVEDQHPKADIDFINPCAETPVQAKEVMKYIDTELLRSIVDRMYSDDFRAMNAFRFPVMAGLRTLIYGKIKNNAFLTNTYHDLITIDGLPDVLGYNGELPSYSQLNKFTNEIMGVDGVKSLFEEMVRINIKEGQRHGLNIGEEITMDASPISACKKDKDATVNGHYYDTMKIYKCFLWHNLRCLETRLPLVFHLSTGTENEGKFFLPLIMKAHLMGAKVKKAYVDGGYSAKENIASAKQHWDIDVKTNISKSWKQNNNATMLEITKQYSKLWNKMEVNGYDFYDPKADYEYKEMAMIMMNDGERNRHHELLGDIYRNDILACYEECPDGYLDDYHQRNIVESTHGTEKRNGTIKRTEVRGIKNNTVQLGLHLLALHLVANTRLRHGITKGLTNIGHIR